MAQRKKGAGASDDTKSFLDRTRDEVPEPSDIPEGTWRLKAANGGFVKEGSGPNGEDVILIPLTAVEATDDVDPDEAESFLADEGGNAVFYRQVVGNNADYHRVVRDLDKFGADTEGQSPRESVKAIKGYEVFGYVHYSYDKNDPSRRYVNVKSITPVE